MVGHSNYAAWPTAVSSSSDIPNVDEQASHSEMAGCHPRSVTARNKATALAGVGVVTATNLLHDTIEHCIVDYINRIQFVA